MRDKNVLVVAPHPDDETLGCGGTLLSLKANGNKIHWLLITDMFETEGYSSNVIMKRDEEIKKIYNSYEFDNLIKLGIPATQLDVIKKGELISKIANVFDEISPNIVFMPYINDIHSDHKLTSEAVLSCTKWFRHKSIEKVLFYETISETNFNINTTTRAFKPNVYVNIGNYLEQKIEIMSIYESEFLNHPFPRSEKAIRSLASLRGSESGYDAAEAFELLKDTMSFEF